MSIPGRIWDFGFQLTLSQTTAAVMAWCHADRRLHAAIQIEKRRRLATEADQRPILMSTPQILMRMLRDTRRIASGSYETTRHVDHRNWSRPMTQVFMHGTPCGMTLSTSTAQFSLGSWYLATCHFLFDRRFYYCMTAGKRRLPDWDRSSILYLTPLTRALITPRLGVLELTEWLASPEETPRKSASSSHLSTWILLFEIVLVYHAIRPHYCPPSSLLAHGIKD